MEDAGVEVGKWRDVGVGGENVEGCRYRSRSVKNAAIEVEVWRDAGWRVEGAGVEAGEWKEGGVVGCKCEGVQMWRGANVGVRVWRCTGVKVEA